MTPPESSEQILEETEKKEVKQELENNRLVKQNKIFETNQDIRQRILNYYESINTDGHLDDKIKGIEDEMESSLFHQTMTEHEDITENMPIIPMGENTHKKNKLGFRDRANEDDMMSQYPAQIKMSKALEADIKRSDKSVGNITASTAQVLSIRNAWNNLSDEQRELVGTINITKVKKQMKYVGIKGNQAGSWHSSNKTLTMNVNDDFKGSTVRNRFSTVQHEIGHAEWHKLMKDSPEKTNKFIDTIMSDDMKSTPISTYASKYLNTDERLENMWQQDVKRIKALNKEIQDNDRYTDKQKLEESYSDDEIADKKKAFFKQHDEWARTIYANETHSKLSEIVHGTSKATSKSLWTTHPDKPKEAHKNLAKYFKAYQELHET